MADSAKSGMGALVHEGGVAFRVWAPHAKAVSVIGTFNGFKPGETPLKREGETGNWYADVPSAKVGHEYRFHLKTVDGEVSRIDPYAREVTSSIGNGVILDPHYDWDGDKFPMHAWNELVIYELHIGTFHDPNPDTDAPGTFADAAKRLAHLKALGVNAIQVMPIAEFPGDRSWGYNPSHVFAVESAYGGPKGFKDFVKAAHKAGLAVILDVVYNHFGPGDLDLWRFDGWHEGDGGGIYFYQDWRAETPWGHSRPDYGRVEVRQFIRDNALMWIDECHVDGLRMDMTLYIRSVRADGQDTLPDGWSLIQWLNDEIQRHHPHALTIAEDLQDSEWVTKPTAEGGAGFGAQWDSKFVHPVREEVIKADDAQRSMARLRDAIAFKYNNDAFQRVVYTESHDEVANGKARVPSEVNPGDPHGWWAVKRSTLGAALALTSPGIPMLFQGQEFLEGGWFRDTVPLDWSQDKEFRGIVKMYVDVFRADEERNILAYRRWREGGPGDEVVIVANFDHEARQGYSLGFPATGKWHMLFNSDAQSYSKNFSGAYAGDIEAHDGATDGLPAYAILDIAGYTVHVYTQQAPA